MAGAAPGGAPQAAPGGQPGYGGAGYQPPYRAPRQPFMGNLQDHWLFVLVVVITFVGSMSLAAGWGFGGGGFVSWSETGLFTNAVLLFLFNLVFFAAGLAGVAGTIGLWKFLDWGRTFTLIGMGGLGLEGLLTLIGGGASGGRLDGSTVAIVILGGIIKMALGGLVIGYLFSHDIQSRTRPPQG